MGPIIFLVYNLCGPGGRKKGSEATDCVFEPLYRPYSFCTFDGPLGRTEGLRVRMSWVQAPVFTIYTKKYTAYLNIVEEMRNFGPKIFRDNALANSIKSTVHRFEYKHKLCFLTFYTKILHQNMFFFQTSKSTPSYTCFEPYVRRRRRGSLGLLLLFSIFLLGGEYIGCSLCALFLLNAFKFSLNTPMLTKSVIEPSWTQVYHRKTHISLRMLWSEFKNQFVIPEF